MAPLTPTLGGTAEQLVGLWIPQELFHALPAGQFGRADEHIFLLHGGGGGGESERLLTAISVQQRSGQCQQLLYCTLLLEQVPMWIS